MRLNKICHDFYNDGKPWQERNLNKTHMKKKKKRTGYVNHVSLSIWMWVIFVIYEIKSKMKNEFFFFCLFPNWILLTKNGFAFLMSKSERTRRERGLI